MPLSIDSCRLTRAAVVAFALVVGVAACDGGGSSRRAHTTTTTRRRHRPSRTTTTTTAAGGSSTTASTAPTTGTTAPTLPPTTAPPNAGTCAAASGPITAAVLGGGLGPVPVADYTVTDCRLSSSHPLWSAVTMAPRPGTTAPRLTVALERIGSIWTVHSYAQGATGCDAPPPVPTELRLGC
ncbi:MAG: hypothetical protein ACXVJ7_12350 [Acidimicrobiia bacterium]